ncbi:hypothetical protein CHH83_01260 [Bacillus sp. 7586-K]|nr:hypothetical protein CHH83_01260 [Bacillus sp. 7586-K]
MEIKEAKEFLRAGFAWANWTDEQREAMKVAYTSMVNIEKIEKEWRRGNETTLDETLEEIFNR